MVEKRYRVAQWATGDAGIRALRAIIEHPQLDLVGVRVYSNAKAGKDAGKLCGTVPTGVIATKELSDIIATRPDCVSYMPNRMELEIVCALLEAGVNVVTPLTGFSYRDGIEPETRGKLETACERGQSSLYCTGATPGWFTETLPFALSMMERRIDCITLFDYGDMSSRTDPDMLFRVLPFGKDPAMLGPDDSGGRPTIVPGSMAMTAKALGLELDDHIATTEFAVAQNRVELPAGGIEAGTIGGWRRNFWGLRKGKRVMCRISSLYVTKDLDPAWELYDTGQRMRIEGDVPFDLTFTMLGSPDDYPNITPSMTANPVVNAIPYICDALPGICQTDELPQMIGRFG